MILILSTPEDPHAVAVKKELDIIGYPYFLLDTSKYPQEIAITIEQNGANRLVTFSDKNGPILKGSDVKAAWWRRPQPCVVSPDITNEGYHNFARNEAEEAISGLWHSLNVPWVNEPAKDEIAHRKVYQLNIARKLGIRLPNTCITNNPDSAATFIKQQQPSKTICKAFSATWDQWRETRIVGEKELAALENVQYAPVIFQEYIEAAYDLRITAVGNQLFPAAIYVNETAYAADVRMDIGNARMEATTLPERFHQQLLELQQVLDLHYGAIDVRVKPSGEHVFLEVNPAGQWLFIEERTKQPIAKALARYLFELAEAGSTDHTLTNEMDILALTDA